MNRTQINPDDYDDYYNHYINLVDEHTEIGTAFLQGKEETLSFLASIPLDKWDYRYAQYKWSIKEVLQHLIDTERVFSYRLLRLGRGDQTGLAPFDQDIYIDHARASGKAPYDLIKEYSATRDSSIALVNSLSDDDLSRVGESSSVPMSAAAAAFVIPGHDRWHINIIKARYL